jgi:hypothetical protein
VRQNKPTSKSAGIHVTTTIESVCFTRSSAETDILFTNVNVEIHESNYQRGWEPCRYLYEKYGRHEETRTPDLYRVNLSRFTRRKTESSIFMARMK